jgi:histidyl-tRNA synthetase
MATPSYTTHAGMVDILPGDVEKWQVLEALIRDIARTFHFREIRTPILEPTGLIARGVGSTTDIVSKELFAFDRGEDAYVLRPEGTASAVRAYIQHSLHQRGGSQKVFYIGPMFRAERPQKGRQRQFHQFGAEILGSADPLADAEIIAFMVTLYQKLGITNTTLRLNSVGDPASRHAYKTALRAHFAPNANLLSDISQRRLETNPMRILDSKEPEDQVLIEDAPLITPYLSEDSAKHLRQVQKHLDRLGIEYVDDPRLVRGLDYYTRTAFELTSTDLGGQDALGGGGRYDLLVEELGGPATPAVGFAAGIERLLIACQALNIRLGEEPRLDVYLVTYGDEARKWAFRHLKPLRDAGLSAAMDLSARSMKAQMKEADRENTRWTLIVGDEELQTGLFTLRDMEHSTEEKLSFPDILLRLVMPRP